MENERIWCSALKLLSVYLTNRTQLVKIHNTYSNTLITQGVPLGPLFFIIFIDSLFDLTLNGKLIWFIDDTIILLSNKFYDILYSRVNMIVNYVKS